MARVSNQGFREWKYGRGGPGPNALKKVACNNPNCGWKGKRRDRRTKPCPRCGIWPSTITVTEEE